MVAATLQPLHWSLYLPFDLLSFGVQSEYFVRSELPLSSSPILHPPSSLLPPPPLQSNCPLFFPNITCLVSKSQTTSTSRSTSLPTLGTYDKHSLVSFVTFLLGFLVLFYWAYVLRFLFPFPSATLPHCSPLYPHRGSIPALVRSRSLPLYFLLILQPRLFPLFALSLSCTSPVSLPFPSKDINLNDRP